MQEKVEPEKVQKNLTGEMFEKFERFQILTRLRLEPNARFCGKSDCDGFAVGDKNDPMFPVLTCNECGGKICFNCKTNWHPDMTCKANMREVKKKTKDDDKKFDSYLKANKTIKCSKCGAGVQKNDGCNHMFVSLISSVVLETRSINNTRQGKATDKKRSKKKKKKGDVLVGMSFVGCVGRRSSTQEMDAIRCITRWVRVQECR